MAHEKQEQQDEQAGQAAKVMRGAQEAFFIDADVVSRKGGKTAIRLFLKGAESGKAIPAYDSSFLPYFLFSPNAKAVGEWESARFEQFKESLLQSEVELPSKFGGKTQFGSVKKIGEAELLVRGVPQKFLKIFCSNPSFVPVFSKRLEEFGECFEHDIPFHFRYVIDKKLVPNARVSVEPRERAAIAGEKQSGEQVGAHAEKTGGHAGKVGAAHEGENYLELHAGVHAEGKRELHAGAGFEIKKISPTDGSWELAPLRVLSLDIETYNPTGVVAPSRDPCIMISFADSSKDARVFTHTKIIDEPFVHCFKDEKEMLEAFCVEVRKRHADVLCTYNGDSFDLPYLQERAIRTGADFRLGRDSAPVKVKKLAMRSKSSVGGRVHFDVYSAMTFLNIVGAIRLPRLTLDSAYREILGGKKVDLDHEDIWTAWETGVQLKKLAEYSRVDAVACLELAKYALPMELELSRLVGMPLFDSSRASSGQLVEFLLLRESSGSKELVPNKPSGSQVAARNQNPIQGAFVKMPQAGVYENIAVLDFRSLYPSIIISHNIDPSTLNCECCKNDSSAFVSPQGHRFCAKRKGIIPRVLEHVLDSRMTAKGEMKKLEKESGEYKQLDARQFALKVLANSIGPDEPLVLMDEAGLVRIMSASEFIDPAVKSESAKVGDTIVGQRAGWSAACFVNGKTFFKRIKAVMRHRLKGPLFEVRLKSGRAVRLTGDHSAFTLDGDGKIVQVRGSCLSQGSLLVVPKRLPTVGEKNIVLSIISSLSRAPKGDLGGVVITSRLPFPKDVLMNFARVLASLDGPAFPNAVRLALGFQHRTVSRLLGKLEQLGMVSSARKANGRVFRRTEKGSDFAKFILGVIAKMKYNRNKREHFAFLADVRDSVNGLPSDFFDGFKVGALNGRRVGNKLVVDERRAAFLGYYSSEGYARKWKNQTGGFSYRLALTNYDDAIFSEMLHLAEDFGLPVRKSRRNVELNQQIAFLLSKCVFEAGCNAYEKQVPPVILSSPSAVQRAFLQAYFKGDGNYEKHAKRTRFTTVSEKLACSLVVLLNQLGFGAVSIKRDGKFFRVVVNEDVFENTGRKHFGKFSNLVPARFFEKEIRLLKKPLYRAALKHNFSRQQLEKFYSEYLPVFGRSERVESFIAFLKSDLAVDAVERVSVANKPPEWVYDLSVEDAENFIGGFGGVCLHNSFYGYTVYARSRWYSRECGESTTAFGRHYIQDVMQKAENEGFRVLYGDTDSLMILYEKNGEQKVLDFQKGINASLPGRMELELEDFYPRGIFVGKKLAGKAAPVPGEGEEKGEAGAKKKYALINKQGKIKIRGFELVRRDWSKIARATQKEVLRVLLEEGDVQKAVGVVRGAIERLNSGKVPLEDVVIMTQLQKKTGSYEIVSPEVSAALKARKAGINVPEGAVMQFVITKQGKTISEKAQVLELAKDYDAEYYVNNQIVPTVLKILGAFGIDAEQLKTGKAQRSLGDW